ncbi:hypothetical protein PENSPDRAFT_667303 [Peniophora sp. CONT]|nr:hypothetical protein PENSPDRAFT_667303 [Peniophora sp. CONT]
MSAESTSVFPLVNPGKPSSLRRSHSVASESLPTPPSTIRKRPRTGSRSSVFSDDEENGSDELPRPLSPEPSKKKRRLDEAGKAVASGGDETEEDEFWGPKQPALKKKRATTQSKRRSTRSKSPPKVTASASRAAAASTLLSPPPTRPRDPVTPPRRTFSKEKGKDKDVRPVRDSPNNPFLVALPADAAADSDADSDVEVPSSPLGPKTPLPELPTMTYVFRGKKQIFANPFFGAQPDPRSTLSPRHPEYSPSEMCAPRRLFKSRSSSSKLVPQSEKERARAASPDPWDSEDEEAGKPMPRLALTQEFAKARDNGAVAGHSDDEDEDNAAVVDKRQASRSRSRSHSHHEDEDDEATVAAPTSDTVAPEAHSDDDGEPTPKVAKITRAGSSRASYKNGVVRSASYVKKATTNATSRSRSRSDEELTAEV